MSKQFDLEAFKAFVASKPADERYNGTLKNSCALAQFGLLGLGSVSARDAGIPSRVYTAACCSRTFGQLADRLDALDPRK